jgi:hypothetical protein
MDLLLGQAWLRISPCQRWCLAVYHQRWSGKTRYQLSKDTPLIISNSWGMDRDGE